MTRLAGKKWRDARQTSAGLDEGRTNVRGQSHGEEKSVNTGVQAYLRMPTSCWKRITLEDDHVIDTMDSGFVHNNEAVKNDRLVPATLVDQTLGGVP